MYFLKNLSLFKKVVGVIALLSLVAGMVTWRGNQALMMTEASLNEVFTQRVTPLRHLKIVSDMYAVNIVDASHKARNNNLSMAESLAYVVDAMKRIDASWKDYVEGVQSDKERALIKEVNALKVPADGLTERLVSILKADDRAGLDALVTQDLYAIIDPLTGKVSELIDLQVAEAGGLLEAADKTIGTVSMELVMVAAIGIIVAFLIAVMVMQGAVRRIAATRDTLLKLSRGEAASVEADSQDEVGQMVHAVARLKSKLDADAASAREQAAVVEAKLNALGSGQGVIEFKPDGTILGANGLFLELMGYQQSEIAGQHHRMFVTPEEAQSEAYQSMWSRLASGEPKKGEFLRRTRDGRDVWLLGVYAPIRGADGQVVSVIKCASDVTESKLRGAELQQLVEETKQVMTALASGDLRHDMQRSYSGQLEDLKQAVNGSLENLRKMVGQISLSANSILSGAREIAQGNADLSQRTEQQASSLEETASSMEELTSTVRQNADNARQADQLAAEARGQAEAGGSVVSSAVNAMAGIEEASRRIADIIGVIDEIAFQTNLLALNAAVEAARAGEQGRGFAVVASEVRNLAQRSAGAAKEIKGLINDSVAKVGEGSRLVDASGQTLNQIMLAVKKVSDIIGEIAAASEEQSAGIEQVNRAVTQMDQTTQQNAALVEEAAAASESMDEQARALAKIVGYFRVTDEQLNNARDNDMEEGFDNVKETPTQAAERRAANRPWAGKASHSGNPASRATTSGVPAGKVVGGDDWEEF